jgi:hypothetical protein
LQEQRPSKRTKSIEEDYEVNSITSVNDEIKNSSITLGSLRYEEDFVEDNHEMDINLANISFNKLYISEPIHENICHKAERRITLDEAIHGPDSELWIKSIQEEYKGQNELKTFTICLRDERPELDWILIFKRKFDDQGVIEKYKTRATLRGDKQVEDADFWELYAPVGKLSSLRIFIALVAYLKLQWIQMDFIQAFLQATPKERERIHLKFPPLYNIQEAINKLPLDDPIRKIPKSQWKEKCCLHMNKSIYGLKQAPKNWYELLNKSLIKLGFKPLVAEPCIYIYTRENGDRYFLFVYVDDTLLAGKELSFIHVLIKMIQKVHGVKIIGEPKFILGLKLTRCHNGNILIDQNQYIKDVATRFNVTSNEQQPVNMPCTTSQFKKIELDASDPSLIDLSIDLRTMVGSLMYASLGTRLDITYFVNYISRYLTKPTKYIEKIVRQTIAYLLDTPFIYIICFATYNKSPQITAFCDASHGSELNRKEHLED